MLGLLVWWTAAEVVYGIATVQKGSLSNCTVAKELSELAFVGWPHRFSCKALIDEIEGLSGSDYADYGDDISVQCSIYDLDQGILLFNDTQSYSYDDFYNPFNQLGFTTHDLSLEDSSNYQVVFMTAEMAECKSVMIHLNITAFQQLTCAEAISQQAHNVSLLAKDRSALRCSVPNHVTPKIHVDREEHVMWLRNCKELNLDKNTDWVLDPGGHLTLPRVTYQHPGVYTCAVTYNGMTRYAVHHRVCVKPKNGHGISVKCSSSVYKHQIQEDVTINCRGTGAQDVDLDSLRFMLTKTTSKKRVCNVYGRGHNEHLEPRAACIMHAKNVCFKEAQSRAEIQAYPASIDMKITIRNFQFSDIGEYELALFQRTTNQTTKFVLQLNRVPNLVRMATVVGISLGLVVTAIGFAAVLWWKRIYLFVHYKRKFGTYQPDNKPYGAFLSYHFSTEMDKFAKQLTRDAVAVTRDALESMGYRIYDEVKDGNSSGHIAPNIMGTMRKCHRVIIILTPDYFKDHWNMFTLQKSFLQMIESRSKTIFILTPGCRSYIYQHKTESENFRVINRAIKLNHAILWSNRRGFKTRGFRLRLENSMPKLLSQHFRQVSTTSLVCSEECRYNSGFLRSVSKDTKNKELDSTKPEADTNQSFVDFSIEKEDIKTVQL